MRLKKEDLKNALIEALGELSSSGSSLLLRDTLSSLAAEIKEGRAERAALRNECLRHNGMIAKYEKQTDGQWKKVVGWEPKTPQLKPEPTAASATATQQSQTLYDKSLVCE